MILYYGIDEYRIAKGIAYYDSITTQKFHANYQHQDYYAENPANVRTYRYIAR